MPKVSKSYRAQSFFEKAKRFIVSLVRKPILIIALLFGCGVRILPETAALNYPDRAKEMAKEGILVRPPKHVDRATSIVMGVFSEYLTSLGKILYYNKEPRVFWTNGSIKYDGDRYGGLHYSPDEIYVAWYKTKISKTSFAHELGHSVGELVFKDPDAGHENSLIWDTMVPAANEALEKAGL